MSARQTHRRNERGETLVEMLVAVTILGIAGVAILAGLQLSITTSDLHRKQTTSGAVARNYAEAIQSYVASGNYIACAGADAYAIAELVETGALELPMRYSGTHAPAKRVPPDGGAAEPCSGNDTGVQQLDITIASQDGRVSEELTVILRKPCDPSMPVCT